MHICPTCDGNRESVVFVNTGADSSKHYSEVRKCGRCLGAGYVSQLVMNKIKEGEEHRHQRILHGLSIKQAAELEGVSVSVISKREHGM